jgi:hypothetical protein
VVKAALAAADTWNQPSWNALIDHLLRHGVPLELQLTDLRSQRARNALIDHLLLRGVLLETLRTRGGNELSGGMILGARE